MGRKIFISYKFYDDNVELIPGCGYKPTVRDYVNWLEKKFNNRTSHYYKGESDNEDLSIYSEDYIWNKLKDKIFDSSITIVLISPNMKEYRRHERSQWIPWEISYSLRKTPRSAYTSQRNAVLAVVLPDKNGSYDYYKRLNLFKILQDNINIGYIPVVYWGNFKYDCDRYINMAYNAQNTTPEYSIHINL